MKEIFKITEQQYKEAEELDNFIKDRVLYLMSNDFLAFSLVLCVDNVNMSVDLDCSKFRDNMTYSFGPQYVKVTSYFYDKDLEKERSFIANIHRYYFRAYNTNSLRVLSENNKQLRSET